jgi:uncharacterized protein (DUF1697 family)
VFWAEENRKAELAEKMGSRILESHGFNPKVLLLKVTELEDAIKNSPFKTGEGKTLHIFFLESQPLKPDLDELASLKSNSEEFQLDKNIFYLYAPDGIGRSRLAARVEKALGVPATARNWNTVNKLVAMAKEA